MANRGTTRVSRSGSSDLLFHRFNRLSRGIPIARYDSHRFPYAPRDSLCREAGSSNVLQRNVRESCGKSVPLLGPTSTYLANLLSSYRPLLSRAYLGISTFTTKDARSLFLSCPRMKLRGSVFVHLPRRSPNVGPFFFLFFSSVRYGGITANRKRDREWTEPNGYAIKRSVARILRSAGCEGLKTVVVKYSRWNI